MGQDEQVRREELLLGKVRLHLGFPGTVTYTRQMQVSSHGSVSPSFCETRRRGIVYALELAVPTARAIQSLGEQWKIAAQNDVRGETRVHLGLYPAGQECGQHLDTQFSLGEGSLAARACGEHRCRCKRWACRVARLRLISPPSALEVR